MEIEIIFVDNCRPKILAFFAMTHQEVVGVLAVGNGVRKITAGMGGGKALNSFDQPENG